MKQVRDDWEPRSLTEIAERTISGVKPPLLPTPSIASPSIRPIPVTPS